MRTWGGAAAFAVLVTATGCASIAGLESRSLDQSGSGADGGGAAPGGNMSTGGAGATGGSMSGSGAAGGGGGSTDGMVRIDLPVNPYFIDILEVTNEEYLLFVDDKNPPAPGPECMWNMDYAPDPSAPDCNADYDPTSAPNQPVRCIDWCDAQAYCIWAGKRLCGAIGGGPSTTYHDANVDEWNHVCSQNGISVYPYGDVYDASLCFTQSGGSPSNVGTHPQCTGTDAPFDQVFDMSGNISEWTDACASLGSVEADPCSRRGGAWYDGSQLHRCRGSDPDGEFAPRDAKQDWTGFRCCADG